MQSDLFSGFSPKTKNNDDKHYEKYSSLYADYSFVNTLPKLKELIAHLNSVDEISFDTETTSVNAINTTLVGISFTTAEGVGWYVPTNTTGLSLSTIIDLCREPLENPDIKKIAHNFKFDYQVLHQEGIKIQGEVFDTMVAAYLIDNTQRVKMDKVAKKYLGYSPISIDRFLKGKRTMMDFPAEEVMVYACEDADITYRLYKHLQQKLEDDHMTFLAEKVEFPVVQPLATMELNGVNLDTDFLKKFQGRVESDLQEIESKMYKTSGKEFNIGSWQQVGEILYDVLNYPVIEKTKTGGRATGEDTLNKLKKMPSPTKVNVPELILEYRSLSKLNGTYIKGLPPKIEPSTGKLHTNFNQTRTTTGRLSSSEPNLQNIPNRDKLGRQVRRAFMASEGYSLLSADYSQMELRIIASICEDKNMLSIFNEDKDIHTATAAEINKIALTEVSEKQRYDAKTVNYLIPYGGGVNKLASELKSSRKKAQKLLDSWFNQFPNVYDYIEGQKEFAKEHGYVKTMFGRRRYLPEINHGNKYRRFGAERQAVNMPIQGASSDIMKMALVKVHEWIYKNNIDARILLQVHDELLLEAKDEIVNEVGKEVVSIMENAADIGVFLKVDYGTSKTWEEGH